MTISAHLYRKWELMTDYAMAIIGLVMAVISFLGGYLVKARADGQKEGVVVTKLEHIDKIIDKIRSDFESAGIQTIGPTLEMLSDKVKDISADVKELKTSEKKLEIRVEMLNNDIVNVANSVTRAHKRLNKIEGVRNEDA